MPTSAEHATARSEVLAACREIFDESPSAWIGWEEEDVPLPELAVIAKAAAELDAEGLIKAVVAEDGTSVEAQITPAGLLHLKTAASQH